MLRKYKHISFDLDGTLVHTISDYRYWIVPFVVKKLGGAISSLSTVDEFWFEADRDETVSQKFKLNPKTFWQLFKQIDTPRRRSKFTFAYHDVEDCFWRLNKMGKLISVITGAPLWISKMEVRKLNNAPVDFYLTTNTHRRLKAKPHPSGMYYVLKRLGAATNETVYVGNSDEDAMFAQNSGVDFIYLERQEHKFNFQKTTIAIIETLNELE
jgi:phosphoglycolate phosphatase-like HAD superfamily hydrolase